MGKMDIKQVARVHGEDYKSGNRRGRSSYDLRGGLPEEVVLKQRFTDN